MKMQCGELQSADNVLTEKKERHRRLNLNKKCFQNGNRNEKYF